MKRLVSLVALSACVVVIAFSVGGYAGQSRSITERVYSAGQAARGQQLYTAQCVDCHGKTLEGGEGPALTGDSFLSNWSASPLTGLVDKIQKTMPLNRAGSLSRQQSIDLSAYILQAGKFPAGSGDLTDSALSQIVFPSTPAKAASVPTAGAPATLGAPEGNLAEVMRAIAFPNANILFNTQLNDPGAQPKKELAKSPFDYVEWGSTVYPGWLAIDQAAVALAESAPLLLTPGRKCQNGRPVPIDRADWKQYVAALVEVGKLAHQLSQKRDYDAFLDISEKLNDACANCHKVYRDKGGAEGSGATRCQ